MSQQIKFRSGTTSSWSTTNPTLAEGEIGVDYSNDYFKIGDGTTAWNALAVAPTYSPTQTIAYKSFGDGGDGNVTINSGVTTLIRDMFYNNLTISGTGSIYTNGFRIFVKGTLDLSNAPVGAINFNGANGNNAIANVAGTVPTVSVSGSLGTGGQGSAGAAGTALFGAASGIAGVAGNNGGSSNNSGGGGVGGYAVNFTIAAGNTASVGAIYTDGIHNYTVTTALLVAATTLVTLSGFTPTPTSGTLTFVSGTGTGPITFSAVTTAASTAGAASAGSTSASPLWVKRFETHLLRGITLVLGGSGGRGGSSGTGDGVNLSGGGGGGGNGGGVLSLYANTIIKSSNTPSGVIQSNGGNGGNGGTPLSAFCGGGGGGSAGGGGWVYLLYNNIYGPTITNLIQANGGKGGDGGNGIGLPSPFLTAGTGGLSGYGGRINIFNVQTTNGVERYGNATSLIIPEVTTGNATSPQFGQKATHIDFIGLCQVNL